MEQVIDLGVALAIVCLSSGLVLGGLYFVHRRFDASKVPGILEVGSIFFAVLGTAYGVLLSFFVVAAWDRYQAAAQTGAVEAADLGSIYWLSSELPNPLRREVQDGLLQYTQVVIQTEWPLMAKDQESPQAWSIADGLWRNVLSYKPATPHDQVIYDNLLGARQQLDHDRRIRLLSAENQIPTALWVVLALGGLMTVLFTYHFHVERFGPQALMTGVLTGLIVLVLLLVYQLDHPYQGLAKIPPTGFSSIASLVNAPSSTP